MLKMTDYAFKRKDLIFQKMLLGQLVSIYSAYFRNEVTFKLINEENEGIGSTKQVRKLFIRILCSFLNL